MRSATDMDLGLVRDINRLWGPVYEGLARQVADLCASPPVEILEVGCFSGGVGLALLDMFPASRLTVAIDAEELVGSFEADWQGMIDETQRARLTVVRSPLAPMDLPADTYDLAVFRGVFFFLDTLGSVPAEMSRVPAPGGIAFIGGGFGSHTDTQVIQGLAQESRRLNFALGKRVVSRAEFRQSLADAGLEGRFKIVEEGGLWAIIQGGRDLPYVR